MEKVKIIFQNKLDLSSVFGAL